MNRLTVLQKIIDSINAKYYLEIGVETGIIILNLNVRFKHGVDPDFKIPNLIIQENKYFYDNKKNVVNLYPLKSSEFFDNVALTSLYNGLDIVFIDGLHTYKQCLDDIKNSLNFLNKNGFIVVHDCNPLSYAMSYPVKESIDEVKNLAIEGNIVGWNDCWNGDVWKSILHLRLENNNLNIFTLDLDWGLSIITKGKPEQKINLDLSISDIEELDYSFLEKNRNEILNLKHPRYIYDFLDKNNL